MNSVTAERAGGARAAPLALARAVPAWAWLAGLVAASAVLRFGVGRRMVAPWIMVDELIYSELARSFADTGTFLIRGEAAGGAYGVVYPLLLSPAYALWQAVPDAYLAARTINAVVMSLAAVPAYLLARRVLAPPLALAAAALALALPSMLYTGVLMTENAFYPLFLLAALALVLVLERPTALRTLAFLAVAAVAFATRAQAVVLLPALALAPVVLVLLRGTGARALGAFRSVYATLALAAVAVVAAEAVRGRSPLELLGAYRAAGEARYELGAVARSLLLHVSELTLYVAVVPVAALLVLLARPRGLRPAEQALLAAVVALSATLLPVVAAFAAAHTSPFRVEERNMFYLAPLYLIALLLWVERGAPRPPLLAAGAAAAAAALPVLLPYGELIGVEAQSDTLALLALWWLQDTVITGPQVPYLVASLGLVLAALFLAVPRRYALALPLAVGLLWTAAAVPIENGAHGMRRASIGALFQGITLPERDWIDRAVGRDAEVALVWSGRSDAFTIWQNEFFTRGSGPVYHLSGGLPGGLPQTQLELDERTGAYLDPGGGPVRAGYAFADDEAHLDGEPVARDEHKGTALLRVDGPLRATTLVEGLYADRWSEPVLRYTRYRCAGGSLRVELEQDPNLLRRTQTVKARGARTSARGVRELSVRVPPGETRTFSVPLARGRDGHCRVAFTVTPTAVPRGGDDERELGIRFLSFEYRP